MLQPCWRCGSWKNMEENEENEEIDEEEPLYVGQRDAEGNPNGRGTLKWLKSSRRFEGRFCGGMKQGRGCFYFGDGSSLSGTFTSDELHGEGTYTYPDGRLMIARYANGELDGPFTEYSETGDVMARGEHREDRRFGYLQIFDEYGGILMGEVSRDSGELTGTGIAYIYPDKRSALLGQFSNGEMVSARPALLQTSIDETPAKYALDENWSKTTLKLDESTSTRISCSPLIPDAYERSKVYVSTCSENPDKGEGLFAKTELAKGEIVSFYNGLRLTHDEVDSRDWSLNANTITLDESTVLDVPLKYSSLEAYVASLGHKANHSGTPNCEYDHFVHPRFGHIKCIQTIKEVSKGDELTCDYGYSHKLPGTDKEDLPEWYNMTES